MTIEFENYDELTSWTHYFIIDGKKYVCEEADGYAGERYKSASVAGAVMNSQTNDVTVGDIGATETILVGDCCYQVDDEGNKLSVGNQKPHRVGQSVVRLWSEKIIKRLADDIKKHSGLKDDEKSNEDLQKEIDELQKQLKENQEDELGNSLAGTMHG